MNLRHFAAALLVVSPLAANAEQDLMKYETIRAEKFCYALDATGLLAKPCKFSGWGNKVSISVDMSSSEARKLCAVGPEMLQATGGRLDGWTFEISSPYSTGPIATCKLG